MSIKVSLLNMNGGERLNGGSLSDSFENINDSKLIWNDNDIEINENNQLVLDGSKIYTSNAKLNLGEKTTFIIEFISDRDDVTEVLLSCVNNLSLPSKGLQIELQSGNVVLWNRGANQIVVLTDKYEAGIPYQLKITRSGNTLRATGGSNINIKAWASGYENEMKFELNIGGLNNPLTHFQGKINFVKAFRNYELAADGLLTDYKDFFDLSDVTWAYYPLRPKDIQDDIVLDISGNERHLTKIGTSKPTKLSNNKRGMVFDGNGYLEYVENLSGSFSIVMVVETNKSNLARYLFDCRQDSGTYGYAYINANTMAISSNLYGAKYVNYIKDEKVSNGKQICVIGIMGFTVNGKGFTLGAYNQFPLNRFIGNIISAKIFNIDLNGLQLFNEMWKLYYSRADVIGT